MNNKLWLTTILWLLSISAGQAQDPFAANIRPTDPLSPSDEQRSFQLPPGFEIQLFASEPDILKPLNMAFDARGRLWLTETREYPVAAPPDRPGRDQIKILEDSDGDGHADRITTFADGLNIPIGIYPYRDGAIAFSIPFIWHLRDTDGDGQADERRQLYGPLGFDRDTHGLNNAFRRGFDGWLYACHGFNNNSTVSGTDGHSITMNSGNTYRVRLDGSRIEQFTWGQVNPFGMTFDPLGNIFTADCHSKPVYQLLRGAYYPSFGKPHDGLGFVPPMMEHLHGSTAIAGVAFYGAGDFPEPYRGNLFSGNVMTSRVNRNSLVYHGSTILAHEEPDFVATSDPWFRPVDIQVGPDGALYIADFYNRIIGHYEVPLDHPGRDRFRGRIWRVVYRGEQQEKDRLQPTPPPLADASVGRLIEALGHENLTYRLLAADQLVDRVGAECTDAARQAFRSSTNPEQRSHLLWVLYRLNAVSPDDLRSACHGSQRQVRVHAMKVLSETAEWSDVHRELATQALDDPDGFVRRAATDALGRHPQPANIRPLLRLLRQIPPEDNHLIHSTRMALRDQFSLPLSFVALGDFEWTADDMKRIAGVCVAVRSAEAGSFLLRFLEQHEEPPAVVAEYLQHAARYAPHADSERLARFARERFSGNVDFQLELLNAVYTGLQQRGDPVAESMRDWGATLARQLITSVDRGAASWSNQPIPNSRNSANPWTIQARPSADGVRGARFLCSLPRGEQLTGVLRSSNFAIPAKLSFYMAGHDGFPNQAAGHKNRIRLRDAGTDAVLAESEPPRHDVAQHVEWHLSDHAGRQGYLEVVDGDDGRAYAWLAVGRFDPAVVELPEIDPALAAERLQAAAVIVGRLKLEELAGVLRERMLATGTEMAVQAVVANVLAGLSGDGRLVALAQAVGDASVSAGLREQICRLIADPNRQSLQPLLSDAFQMAPQRLQQQMAQSLAQDKRGATALLDMVAEGKASARLLVNRTVRQLIDSAMPDDAQQRIAQLTARVPAENETLNQLIAARVAAFGKAQTSKENGKQLFIKHCSACHQIQNEGKVVGPQLDGIGNRGLERIVEDVVDPNRNVDVAFHTTTIRTSDGIVVSGLFRREEGATLVLVDNKGEEFAVPAGKVDERVKTTTSLMPENLVTSLTEQEFYDLLAFLLTNRAVKEE